MENLNNKMENLKNKMLASLESKYTLDPIPIPEDLMEIKRFLGVFKLNMYNWKTEKIRKISMMRCSVKVPDLEVYAIEIYPEPSNLPTNDSGMNSSQTTDARSNNSLKSSSDSSRSKY